MSDRESLQAIPGLEIREEIGCGGMGSVYKAYQPALDRVVALKTVQREYLTDTGLELFQQEARLLAKCNHPNIVRILEFHPEHDAPYFLMEYIDGIPIDQALQGQSWSEIAKLFQEIVSIVAAAHQFGVVHGDLKPKNILVDRRSKPWVLDFGLARLSTTAPEISDSAPGTPLYMAPEMFEGKAATVTSDIYALGVTLYQLLTGLVPYPSTAEALSGRAKLPCELNPDIPEPLQRICLKALESDPDNRYQTAEQLAQDIERFRKGHSIYVRPTRYDQELDGRVRNHVTDIHMWKREGLVSQRESDALTREYQRIQDADSPWRSDVRTLLTGPMLLRVGSWLLLLGSAFCPIVYWTQMQPFWRLFATGIPMALMAVIGAIYLVRGHRRYALACFGSFVLLLTVFQVAWLAEFKWFRALQSPQKELLATMNTQELYRNYVGLGFADIAHRHHSPAEAPLRTDQTTSGQVESGGMDRNRPGQVGMPPPIDRKDFLLSNSQLFVVALTATICIALLMYVLQAPFFATWLAISICFLYGTLTLLIGDWERLRLGNVAWVATHYVLLGVLLYAMGLALEKKTGPRVGRPFYSLALMVGGLAAVILSGFAVEEWFDQRWSVLNKLWNFWLMVYAGLFFMWGWQTERVGPEGQRVLTKWLYVLVPLFLLIPLQLLFSTGMTVFVVNSQSVHLYAVLYLLACGLLLFLGRIFQLEILIVASLWGSALWIVRMTARHFLEYEEWVIGIASAGLLAIALGIACSLDDDAPIEVRPQRRPLNRWRGRRLKSSTLEMETVLLPARSAGQQKKPGS